MKNIIFCFLISSLFFSSGNLHSSQKSDVEASIPKRLLTDSGFVEFLVYFGPFSTSKVMGHIRKLILPLIFESKIGSQEPKNRQKLNSITVSKGVTSERMAILKLLMHKNLMLTFVSHPKTMEYFLRERQRKNDYLISLRTEVESLQRQFPSDPLMKRFSEHFFSQIYWIENPLPYEEVIMPFLAWGVANLYGVHDDEAVKGIQDLQVKLFKNCLYREGIGSFGMDLTQEIELFSRNSSLPIFSQIIRPLLQGLLNRDAEIDDLVYFYSSDKRENLSAEQAKELEEVYNPPKIPGGAIKVSPFNFDLPEWNLKLDDTFWEEIEKILSPCGKERCPSEDAIEGLEKRFFSQNFFSLESLIELFFEVMIEVYPDHKEFFVNVQQGKAVN